MATIGIDISSVAGNGTPDWDAAVRAGHLRFVGLRAIQGLTPDPWYRTYVHQLDARGIPHFPYFLITPNLDTPEAQARKALDVVGTLNDHYFPLALDVEGDRRGLDATQWLDWVVRAKRVVEEALGVPPLIYTSRTYWRDAGGMQDLPAPDLVDCLGWWKYWPYSVGGQRSPAVYAPSRVDALGDPPAPSPWNGAWGLHQYQGDALAYPGFKSNVDMSRLHVQKEGDHGASVAWIQRRLPTTTVDGIFGPKTAQAVKDFQARMQLEIDGIVGLDTTQRLTWVAPRSLAA